METSNHQSSQILATVLLCFLISVGCVNAAPKGAELLMQHSKNRGTGTVVQLPPKPSPMEPSTTTTELHTYEVKVVTDSEECALVFEAVARDTTDCIVGVTRRTSEDLHETRLAVRTSLSSLAQLKSVLQAALKRVSQTGFLQQSTVVDTAQMSFAAATIADEDGGLVVRIPQSPIQAKATSLIPTPEPVASATLASSLPPLPRSKSTTNNGAGSDPTNEQSGHGSAERSGLKDQSVDGQTPLGLRTINSVPPKRADTGFVASLVVVMLLLAGVGLWVTLRAGLRVFIYAHRRFTRPVTAEPGAEIHSGVARRVADKPHTRTQVRTVLLKPRAK
jgi:hypothetical protein